MSLTNPVKSTLILFILWLLPNFAFAQEKKIEKALTALNNGEFELCNNYILEFKSENYNSPLVDYAMSKLTCNQKSPYFNLELGYKYLQNAKSFLQTNSPDKNWCKKFDFCIEKIDFQLDSIASLALQLLKKNPSDIAYDSYFKNYTNSKMIDLAWKSFYDWKYQLAIDTKSITKLEEYVTKYSKSHNLAIAKNKIEELYFWECTNKRSIPLCEDFLVKYPKSIKTNEVKFLIIDLEMADCKVRNTIVCLENFLKKYPDTKYTSEVQDKIEEYYFENAKKTATKEEYEKFLTNYPNSKYREQVLQEIKELATSISLICIGTGKTSVIAKQEALQNAMNRVLSTFITSNNDVLNDYQLKTDLIAPTSGTIKSAAIINEIELPDLNFASIVRVTISINNLQKFAEAKGIIVEYKGGEFAEKMKRQQISEKAEFDALYSLFGMIYETMQTAFDYDILTSDPISINDGSQRWAVNVNVIVKGNDKLDQCFKTLISSLEGISMSEDEVTTYVKINKPIYTVDFDLSKHLLKEGKWEPKYENWKGNDYYTHRKIERFHLRKQESVNILKSLVGQFDFYLRNFEVENDFFAHRHKGSTLKEVNLFQESYVRSAYGRGMQDLQSFIAFPISKDTITIFEYQDFFTLDELSKLSFYKVRSLGVSVKVKHGGYVVYEKNGKGMVLSIADYPLSKNTFFSNKMMAEADNNNFSDEERVEFGRQYNNLLNSIYDLSIGGYNEWILPTETEFRIIHKNLIDQFSPKCGEMFKSRNPNKLSENEENEINDEDENLVLKTCYETKNGEGFETLDGEYLTSSINGSESKEFLRQGAGFLVNRYLSNTFNCVSKEFEYGSPKYKVLFNYDSTKNTWEFCKSLTPIFYSNTGESNNKSFVIEDRGSDIFDYAYNKYSFDNRTNKQDFIFRFIRYFDENQYENKSPKTPGEVKIGYQTWMDKNLNVEKFRNGDPIPEAKTREEWEKACREKKPVWCFYNNDPANGNIHGKLYNCYAVNDPRGLAPYGWRIPKTVDFRELIEEIGLTPENVKSATGWKINGNNKTGFSAFPSGKIEINNPYQFWNYIGNSAAWWTNEINHSDHTVEIIEMKENGFFEISRWLDLSSGFSVRCIKIE